MGRIGQGAREIARVLGHRPPVGVQPGRRRTEQALRLVIPPVARGDEALDKIQPRPQVRAGRLRPCGRDRPARCIGPVQRKGDLGRSHKISRRPRAGGQGRQPRPLGPEPGARQRRGRQRRKGRAQGQVGQHLLAVGGIGDDGLGRRLADPGGGGLALTDGDAALGVGQGDDAFQHCQSGAVALDRQGEVGAPDRRRCRRRFDRQAQAAAGGPAPERAALQLEDAVGGRADLLDDQRGVPRQPHLRAVGEQHGQLACGVGPQHVAPQQVLRQLDRVPARKVDELHLLAGFAGDDRARRRCASREGVCGCRA